MKLYRAIYSTEMIKAINYDFYAETIEDAIIYVDEKFSVDDIKIVELDEESLEEIEDFGNEFYTIVKQGTDCHYSAMEERFYEANWERKGESRGYLKELMSNDPEKFENCVIELR